ncbi:MAG: Natural resistance-associated macrophage protein [Candidatus Yanofskybacteria bacterium GW2011_GWA2_44_10]|nr:MAG: Natural resistance-associated macrophage protein [Candidatus Yanofskybacteria bacterium GW2011_GWA2_44_10]
MVLDRIKKFWKTLGAGFITGASDDEPSAIATYSIAGAKFGYSMLWAAVFTFPFKIAMQEMSGKIGRISGRGLAGNMKRHYPRWLVFLMALLIVTVNAINIGADMSGMAQAAAMLFDAHNTGVEKIIAFAITLIILPVVIFMPYKKIFSIFKWLSLSLFAYIFATFTVHQNWPEILYRAVVPSIFWTKDFFLILIAFLGTTLSPYLYFWQANQEIEEATILQCKPGHICKLKPVTNDELKILKRDTRFGMVFSNLITFFIITLTASTLFRAGITNIETLKDAAEALRPLAGEYSYLLFSLGIISSGFLAIPVLAGSAAYVISEIFNWPEGLNKSFTKAPQFYSVIIASTVIGLLIPILGFHPVRALFYTSIMYGLISPFLIFMVMHMANNKKIVGEHTNSFAMNVTGHIVLAVMSVFFIATLFIL